MTSENTTTTNTDKADTLPAAPKTGLWFKNSAGESSASLTFVTIAFTVVIINYILTMFENLGPIKLRTFDPTAATALLTPLLALYFGRRWTDTK